MDIKKNLRTKAMANEWRTLKEFDEHYKQPNYELSTIIGIHALGKRMTAAGGFAQQQRMIQDKRKSLDKALWYSYQGAFVKKYVPPTQEVMEGEEEVPIRALINPNKLKQDYDDKIISIGFEHNFNVGDIFEWCNTGTYWLIYLQDLTELAYFRGDIRKCSYTISWLDEDGTKHTTMAAIRGPVETTINSVSVHSGIIDNPNYSLSILMPLTDDTKAYFKRYGKFYLNGDDTCWRIEAVDAYSTPGILELNAIEYYANEQEDNIEEGLVGALITEATDPNTDTTIPITGETFVKVKQTNTFTYKGRKSGNWFIQEDVPVKTTATINTAGYHEIAITWTGSYSGQFTLCYGTSTEYDSKVIVVESLF